MISKTRYTLVVALLVASAAFTTGALAASNGSITADPATPGDTATHTVTVTVGSASAGSLNGFTIDYANAEMDVSDVNRSQLKTVGIDRGDDESGATVDVSVKEDLSDIKASNNGKTLTLKFSGNFQLNASDELVVVLTGVTNPSAGEYAIPLDVNPQSSGGETSASLAIGTQKQTETATATPEETPTPTVTETPEATPEGTPSTATETTSQTGPGFGIALTSVALLAGALLALRRRA